MSDKTGFQNFRQPVEYIIKQWDRKRNFKNKIHVEQYDEDILLPSYPVFFIRNKKQQIETILYGSNDDPLQWSQEFFRNAKDDKVYKIKQNFPDNSHDFIWIDKNYIDKYDEEESEDNNE